jgi:hypothetical protein
VNVSGRGWAADVSRINKKEESTQVTCKNKLGLWWYEHCGSLVARHHTGRGYRARSKIENHAAMVSLYFMYYTLARVHQTFRVAPAMEAGITEHVWSIDEIVDLTEANDGQHHREPWAGDANLQGPQWHRRAPEDLAVEAGERWSNVRHHVEHRGDSDESHRDPASKFKLTHYQLKASLVPGSGFW